MFAFVRFLGAVVLLTGVVYVVCILAPDYDNCRQAPFECGFDPIGPIRAPFSGRFYLFVVLFLVFDVEIALILPGLEIARQG